MSQQPTSVKLIAKTPQGTVYVSLEALHEAIVSFVQQRITSRKLNFKLERIEFDNFEHEVDFQINIFVSMKILSFENTVNRELQGSLFKYIGSEFQLEPLTINIICSPENE